MSSSRIIFDIARSRDLESLENEGSCLSDDFNNVVIGPRVFTKLYGSVIFGTFASIIGILITVIGYGATSDGEQSMVIGGISKAYFLAPSLGYGARALVSMSLSLGSSSHISSSSPS
jgi:hypothetical protein